MLANNGEDTLTSTQLKSRTPVISQSKTEFPEIEKIQQRSWQSLKNLTFERSYCQIALRICFAFGKLNQNILTNLFISDFKYFVHLCSVCIYISPETYWFCPFLFSIEECLFTWKNRTKTYDFMEFSLIFVWFVYVFALIIQ